MTKRPDLPENFVVAIDGPAGSGKSTIANRLAAEIGGVTIDTGAMYRAVTAKALDEGADPADEEAAGGVAESIKIEFQRVGGAQRIVVDGNDYTGRIREPDVNENVSTVAACPAVRRRMVALQRDMGARGRVVMEGRDIGSNVFPNAEFKFFLIADESVRAERRRLEMESAGISMPHSKVLENIIKRDFQDSARSEAPLLKPSDAIEINSSHLNIDEVLKTMIELLGSGG